MLAKRLIKSVLFCAILILLLNYAYRVLSWKDTAGEYFSSVNSFYELDEDRVDVLFLGSSHCYCSINNSLLWKDYGIASFSLAISGQDLVSTYYTLVEALKTQKPDVICVEMYYAVTEGYQVVGNLYRNTLPFRRSVNSLEAVQALVKDDAPLDYWLKWPIIHTRYAELQREDFQSNLPVYIGYQTGFNTQSIWEASPYEEQEPIPVPEGNEQYIRRIIELAEEEGIELCFFVAPYAADEVAQGMFCYVEEIAREHNVDFLNLTRSREGLSLDVNTDYTDWAHTNYYGAEKVTSYMGKYLSSNYTLPDRRGDARYELWEEDARARQHEVQNQQMLLNTVDLRTYLVYVGGLKGYTFFVSTKGNYLAEDVELSRSLEAAGIGEEFFDGCHVWVFEDGELKYLSEGEAFLHYADLGYSEYVVSGTSENPCVHIDRVSFDMVSDGINIVVYDNVLGKVVDAIGFLDSNSMRL